jgi:hypothetical protein
MGCPEKMGWRTRGTSVQRLTKSLFIPLIKLVLKYDKIENREGVQILHFPQDLLEPPFFIDYTKARSRIQKAVEEWHSKLNHAQPYSVVMITGFVKSGKTTVLRLIPYEFQKVFNQAKVIHVIFDTPNQHVNSYQYVSLYRQLWLQISPDSPPIQSSDFEVILSKINELLDRIPSSIPTLILIDEFQELFKVNPDHHSAVSEFVKRLLVPLPGSRKNQFLAITGSGLAFAFAEIAKMSPLGHHPIGFVDLIPMIEPDVDTESDFSRKTQRLAKEMITEYFQKNYPQVPIDEKLFSRVRSSNPPTLFFLLNLYQLNYHKYEPTASGFHKFLKDIMEPKFIQEYQTGLVPMMNEMKTEARIALEHYCKDGSLQPPEVVFGSMSRYFQPWIMSSSTTQGGTPPRYRLRRNLSTRMLALSLRNGFFDENLIKQNLSWVARMPSPVNTFDVFISHKQTGISFCLNFDPY